ncbi:alpha/beta fold hydrolase [Pigmentiphaga litoralis]|uniref:alpha/beta fold hydrolase n=1 Tax=Pigmentiphaga litoralis TaxID=516702 RepID=UPI003B4395DB
MADAADIAVKDASGLSANAGDTVVGDLPADAARWEATARRVSTPEGANTITWRIWGSGSPVVLLHGNSGSWTHWIRNLEALSANHTLYVPDLPGHGDADPFAGTPSMAGFASLLWRGLDEVLPEQSTPVDILGFSLGSVLAETMAVERPAQVRKLVLLRGSFSDGPLALPEGVRRWRGVDDPAEMAAIQKHNLGVLMIHDTARIDALAVALQTRNVLRTTLDMRPLLASRSPQNFRQLACEIHGVSGEFDVYGGDVAEQGRVLTQVHPSAQFHLIPGAGHWAIYEAADVINPLLVDILAGATDQASGIRMKG